MIQEFRIAKIWRVMIFIILAPIMYVFAQIGWSFLKRETPDTFDYIVIAVSAAVLAFCVWRLAGFLKGKLVVTDSSITQVNALTTKELPFKMAKGFISRKGTLIILPEERGYPTIRVDTRTEKMQELRAELSRHLPDLDEQSIRQQRERLLNDEALGATVEERKETLKETEKFAGYLSLLALLSMLWLFLFPHPYLLALLSALLIPPAVLLAPSRYKGLMHIRERRRKNTPLVYVALFLPSLVLFYRAVTDFHLADHSRIWMPAAVLALVLTVVITVRLGTGHYPGFNPFSGFIMILIAMGIYSYSACVLGNCLLDVSSPRQYTAAVVDKWKSHRKRHTSYKLKLAPWGPQKTEDEVTVPLSLYNKINKGETVDLYLRPGALQAPWFEIRK